MIEWDECDKKLFTINAKAINIFCCGLNAEKFNRISTYKNAKEI